ncbi:MAG: hypothetical protein PHG83_01345 [Patescibacteria group bacterium]|nr:hypothetical protein [Patescibacteria group bacterium]
MDLRKAKEYSAELIEVLKERPKEFVLSEEPTVIFAGEMSSVDDFLMNDERIKNQIAKIISAIDFNVPVDLAVEYAARRTNTAGAQLPKNDAVKLSFFYSLVVRPCQDAIHAALKDVCRSCPNILAFDEEVFIAEAGYRIGAFFDDLFSKWWKWVVIPFRTSKLSADELKKLIQKSGKTDKYSVLAKGPNDPYTGSLTAKQIEKAKQIPLAKMFPIEINGIAKILKQLARNLPDNTDYREYFVKLRKALINKNLKQMEALWIEVDKKWIEISPDRRLIPVHMMEWGYEDPFRIAPEFRLLWRTGYRAKELCLMRKEMSDLAKKFDPEAVKKIERTDIGVFVTILASGSNIDFRLAGQSVPNYPEAQALGMKVFLDQESMEQRFQQFQSLIEKVLDPESQTWVMKFLREKYTYLDVFGHEFGHCFCIDKHLIEVFGDNKSKVEEMKATLLVIEGIHQAIEKNLLGDKKEAFSSLTAMIIPVLIRMLEQGNFNNPTVAPYVNECMGILNKLMAASIITVTESGKIHVDTKRTDNDLIAEHLFVLTRKLISIYKKYDLKELHSFVSYLCNREGGNIQKAYKAINDNLK